MKSYIHHQREVIISLFGKDNDWILTGRSSYEILIKHFKIKKKEKKILLRFMPYTHTK